MLSRVFSPPGWSRRRGKAAPRANSLGMSESLRGKLLIASPALIDPNFRRTVVLIVAHDEDGAVGLILNRSTTTEVAEAVPELAQLVEDGALVSVGGPVQ